MLTTRLKSIAIQYLQERYFDKSSVTIDSHKQIKRVVKGSSRSRFTENKMVSSQFTKNKIGISRFTEKKGNVFLEQKLHTVTF